MNQAAIKNILLGSPPGQFDIILDDLKVLLPKPSVPTLLDPSTVSALRTEWEESTGRSTLATAAATAAGGGGDARNEDASELLVTSVSKAMDTYLASNFSCLGVRAAHTVTISRTVDDTPSTLTINTYAEKIDLHNYQVVSWKGCYAISLPLSSLSSNVLHGQIDVWAHSFENGGNYHLRSNITLHTDINKTTSTTCNDIDQKSAWASSVTQQIESWDKMEVMQKITELFESIHSTYLKRLRRVMPITRTKMDWNVAGHRVVRTLCEGHDKR